MPVSDAKDLPDPLDAPAAPGATLPAADADELVAQLAGDAIEKLIEDADNGILPHRKTPEPIGGDNPLDVIDDPQPVLEADPSELSPQAFEPKATSDDPLRTGMNPVQQPSEAITDASADDEKLAVQSALDSVFHALNDKPPQDAKMADANFNVNPPDDPEPLIERHDAEPTESPAPAQDVPLPIANDDGHGTSDTPALAMSDEEDIAHSFDDAPAQSDVRALLADAVQSSPKGPPAIIVLTLRLLNAPFAYVSDPTRDIVGQIAIVTLVNALAVILYVILFR